MAEIAGALAAPHDITMCMGSPLHCFAHDVDTEPLRGYLWCLECSHMYATADELLTGHNRVLAGLGMPPETDVSRVHCCPECMHDW